MNFNHVFLVELDVAINKFTKGLFDFITVTFFLGILFYSNLVVNYGQFRIYVVASFLLAIFLKRILSKFLWTKCIKRCYNNFKERFNERRKKIINISIIVGLVVLIACVIITSIVIYNQNQSYDDLKDDNDHILDVLDDQGDGEEAVGEVDYE